MSEDTPTARPWQVKTTSVLSCSYHVADANENSIARTPDSGPREKNLANAEHIVLCVNAHEYLVGAVKALKSYVDIGATGEDGLAALAVAEIALKKAGA